MLYAREVEPSYENFIAICPHCNYRNIYNRISDLKTTQLISFKKVQCFSVNCEKTFGINGDIVRTKYISLLFDCYPLYKEKRYSACVLLLAQSLEVFFYHYLKVELLYRPFWKDKEHDIDYFNKLHTSLESSIKSYSYTKLRNIFLNFVVNNSQFQSLCDSESKINNIKSFCRGVSNKSLSSLSNSKLANLLIKLNSCKINEFRNKVVHKVAYRPNAEEVDIAIKEVRELVIKIGYYLEIDKEDINSYS